LKKVAVIFLLLLAAGAVCFAIDPAEGYWLSVDEKTNKVTAGWSIYQEAGKLCGKILSTADEKPGVIAAKCKDSYAGFPIAGKVSQMPVAGTPWIFGLSMEKPGEWAGGNVVNPEDGKMYKCKIIFHAADGKKYKADTLEMRGEIGLGIGRSQYWQKADRETASNLWPK
jgi:uncharacterized protein (DUF2147 family)